MTLVTPANIALALGMVVLVVILGWSQIKGKLDLADGFKDEAGRTSAGRIVAIGAWLASTWYLMAHDFDRNALFDYMAVNIVPYLGGALRDAFATYVASKQGAK